MRNILSQLANNHLTKRNEPKLVNKFMSRAFLSSCRAEILIFFMIITPTNHFTPDL